MRGLLLLALSAHALADTSEAGLRPSFEFRRAPAATPAGERQPANSVGAGLSLGYGLDFSWSLGLRYGYDTTGELSEAAAEGTERHLWRQSRHALTVGADWAPWDEWTPIARVELGGAWRSRLEQKVLIRTRQGEARTAEEPSDETEWIPLARLSALGEWRFRDFWSLGLGGFVEYDGGTGFGAILALTGYRYL